MGSKNTKTSTDMQTMVFDVFSTLKWLERIWKVFCFRFEYKYYRTDTTKYTITWEEFEGIFLDEFKCGEDDEGVDLNEWIIYNTFKKIFEYNNFEIRVYRVYMFFFPYCLHLNGAEGLNFIDLLFDKIIYNLEVEMVASMQESKPSNLDELDIDSDEENENSNNNNKYMNTKNPYFSNYDGDKKLRKSKQKNEISASRRSWRATAGPIHTKIAAKTENAKTIVNNSKKNLLTNLNNNAVDNAEDSNQDVSNNYLVNPANAENLGLPDSSRIMLNKELMIKRAAHIQSQFMVDGDITGSSLESSLLRKYNNEFAKQTQTGFVRKISFEVFKELMFVYFQNNIVQFLKAFKDILTEFKDYEYVDDNLVYAIKDLDKDRISLDLLTSKNIHKFLNNTYEKKLFGIRNNIKRDPNNDSETFLTFDDIYVYMKNNYYFYNCKELYYQFGIDTSI